ncbi:hypothetical protein [Streptomyces sp. NPDC001068]|uniref:hypothetical protein n=1 Tax=Streptomyces sp. NPDC001068 TaxID=3364544 RepID=UPI0036C21125
MTAMTTALHLVPDPEDPTPPPAVAGEQCPTAAALSAVEAPAELPGDVEPGEEDTDGQADLDDEVPATRRALSIPDLRPYADVSWIPDVINAGATGARRWRQRAPERKAARRAERKKQEAAGELVGRRRAWRMAADYLAGTRILVGHLVAWLSGEYGPKDMKVPARLGAVGIAGYCVVRTFLAWPVWGPVGIATVWCCAALGVLHKQRAEQAPKHPTATAPKGVARKPGPPPARAAEQAPAEDAGDFRAEAAEEAPAEPPAPPSREVISGALHGLVGEGRGVLLTTLRQHLGLADTRAVREVLDEASIRVRSGVRTVAGNGPGVHLQDFPPPPPSPDPSHGDGVVAGEGANANANNAESGPQKRLGVDDSYWPEGKGYHFEPRPDNPHGTDIVYHRGNQR